MKETKFIQQNKTKWARFEKLNQEDKLVNPKESAELFTEITEDLSYARTFYKRRSVRVYLNQLSQGVFYRLYKKRGNAGKSIWNFWKTDLPIELYRSRSNLLIAFLSFFLWVFIGGITQHFDPDFVRFILGNDYVDQTLQRIESGNPMGVYGNMGQSEMFLMITLNNIRVAFTAFVFGIFFTLGTHWALLRNGVMLGAFQYWFYQQGLLMTSFLTIWIHGAFEISAIVIAGGAGITFGKGLMFPGTYTRMQALQMAGKRGAKIMASLIPVFVMAGFLEGFVTRNYQLFSDISKWGIIVLSFGLILFYYAIYPILVARSNPDLLKRKPSPKFVESNEEPFYKIRTNSACFTQGINKLMTRFKFLSYHLFRIAIPLFSIAFCLQIYQFHGSLAFDLNWLEILRVIFGIGNFFNPFVFILWVLGLTTIASSTLLSIKANEAIPTKLFLSTFFQLIFPIGIFYFFFISMVHTLPTPGILMLVFLIPFVICVPSSIVFGKEKGYLTRFGKGVQVGLSLWGSSVGLFAMCLGLTVIVIMAISGVGISTDTEILPGIADILILILNPIVNYLFEDFQLIYTTITGFLLLIGLACILPVYFFSFSYQYYTAIEKEEAVGLNDDLKKFGTRNRVYESKFDFEE